ncbi:MAG TPA: methylmalonyl-CoA mutase family protein, partial [Xanthobacteraceae bacterium]|nr:methylmalonyl-CoA mutase family protein [Xanthobacteraceae bacterium]
ARVREEHKKAVARGRDAITGTSAFPDIPETPVAVLAANALPPPAHGPVEVTVTPLRTMRLSEPFEALRDVSDRILAETGSRPKVFLANLGTPAEFTARATFAKNFFETGGIEVITNDGFSTTADMVAACEASGAKLVCLCSTDKKYASDAVTAAIALRAAGVAQLYLAGRPGELEAALRTAGVSDFIYIGCDVVAALRAAHDSVDLTISGEQR